VVPSEKIGFLIPACNRVRGAARGTMGTGPDLEEDTLEVSGGVGAEADITGAAGSGSALTIDTEDMGEHAEATSGT
jgi:hypothetical protein